jgi:hypothetical protein
VTPRCRLEFDALQELSTFVGIDAERGCGWPVGDQVDPHEVSGEQRKEPSWETDGGTFGRAGTPLE